MLQQIETIAQRRNQGPTTVVRSLWQAGVTVIMARSLGEALPEDLKAIAANVPEFKDIPLGSEVFKFWVFQTDLDRVEAIARRLDKKRSQLHRNAIAIGIWIDSRIGQMGRQIDELGQL